MIESFQQNPLLLLFVVIALGYWVGSIRIRGSKLGVAAVLFVGLGFGALSPDLKVPEIIIFLGLSIFVYTVGLSSGPAFFDTFKKRGFKDAGFIAAMLVVSSLIAVGMHYLFDFEAATTAGLFAGSSTNTPALAALLDVIQKTASSQELTEMSQRAVVGYSLSYPMGVLGVMGGIFLMQKLLKIDYRAEEAELAGTYSIGEKLGSRTVRITNPKIIGKTLREIKKEYNPNLVFGRIRHDDATTLCTYDTVFREGDEVVLIGNKLALDKGTELVGQAAAKQITYDRSVFDVRRIFVSNPNLAGETIASLNLPEKFEILITRVQRGDMDILADGDTVLELGDRVLIVAKREDLKGLYKIFGNSLESLSQINLLSFGLGMALGLLLGMVTFELPGGFDFNLGFAGGPLIVALILGKLRRTGPIVWTPAFTANLTLRQIGLTFLLAGIGIRSGRTFLETVQQGEGGYVFIAAAIIAVSTTVITLLTGLKLMRIPFSFLTGMVGSQPAVLDYALEQAKNKFPMIGYTMMLPLILIGKILVTQVLFALLL